MHTDEILSHAFFEQMRDQGFSFALLLVFSEQYELVSREFPSLLGLALAHLPNEDARSVVVRNLWDEYGRGNPAAAHRTLFERFVRAVATRYRPSPNNAVAALPETLLYLQGMRGLMSSEKPAVVLGAIWFCERVTPGEYSCILDALRRFAPFTEQELGFFSDHIGHDPGHFSELQRTVESVCGKDCGDGDFLAGVQQARILEGILWKGILDAASRSLGR